MNRGLIIGIIVAIVIGIGAAVAISYNEPNENSGQISPEGGTEPQEFTITLSEEVGLGETPP
ncbi:MAG: hypothetical protein ACE5EJ_02500 [Nitrosopumilaceae archaeon]